MTTESRPARFITIGFSHYCEKARWALDLARVPYVEDAHVPILHWRSSWGAGGGRTVPVLVTPNDGVLKESTEILKWADRHGLGLYPEDPERRAQVEQWVARFDAEVGPSARRIVYCTLFKGPTAFVDQLMRSTATPFERRILPVALPLVRGAIRRGLGISDEGARRSEAKLEKIVAEVEALLADGRSYLVGDTFSAADLTFAALTSPMVMPPAYAAPLPPESEAPEGFRALVEAWRARPAGKWVTRLYARQRTPA
jgi:glutathione S-transferase